MFIQKGRGCDYCSVKRNSSENTSSKWLVLPSKSFRSYHICLCQYAQFVITYSFFVFFKRPTLAANAVSLSFWNTCSVIVICATTMQDQRQDNHFKICERSDSLQLTGYISKSSNVKVKRLCWGFVCTKLYTIVKWFSIIIICKYTHK